MPFILPLFFILSLVSLPAPVSAGENGECPLWLAPSYTNPVSATFTKLGLYAGQAYEQNSTLPLSELAIPLVDFFVKGNRARPNGENVMGFLENFLWTEEKIGSQWEGSISTPGMIPGIGMLASYHSTYSNVDFLLASVLLRETGDEFPDAGEASLIRGAITPYFNATIKATQNIPVGMELFAGTNS